MSLSIAVGGDLHGHLPAVEPCDLLILLGDILPPGSAEQQAIWQEKALIPWLSYVPAKETILLAGNHDFLWESSPPAGNFHYLENEGLEVFGLRLWGFPWTPPKTPSEKSWAFRKSERAIRKSLKNVDKKTDLFLSHGPPWGIGDWTGSRHGGSGALLEAIKKIKPRAFFCGHIHEGGGPIVLDGSLFLNATLGRKRKRLWRVDWSPEGIFWEG